MKKSFRYVPEVETGNFTALVYSILLNAGKSVLKMEILWKNSLIIATVPPLAHFRIRGKLRTTGKTRKNAAVANFNVLSKKQEKLLVACH
jgi:hypothetical protein